MNRLHTWIGGLPNAQRCWAVLLILIQALLIWQLMSGIAAALVVVTIALAATFARRDRMLPQLRFDRWAFAFSVLFLLKGRYFPHEVSGDNAFIYSEVSYEIASLLIALQLFGLWIGPYRERLPVWFGAFSGLGLVFLGNVRVNGPERYLYGGCVVLAVIAMTFLGAGARRVARTSEIATQRPSQLFKWILCLVPLVVGSVLGQTSSLLLAHNEQQLERFFSGALDSRERDLSPGFSGEAGLESMSVWSHYEADSPMLRITGPTTPTYMRGCVFLEFERNRWRTALPFRPLNTSSAPDALKYAKSGDLCLPLHSESNTTEVNVIDVWPEVGAGGRYFFRPHAASHLICNPGTFQQDAVGNVVRSSDDVEGPYRLLVPSSPPRETLGDNDRQQYLKLPEDLDSRVVRIADEVFTNCTTTAERIEAVETFFQENFRYRFGIQIPRGEDRLGYFLDERVPAHCEYFAAATTILLRKHGVPARFVTGYVAGEWNATGGFWTARRRDAHAWVEAYDDVAERWVIVESTPSGGVPETRQATGSTAFKQTLTLLGIRLRHFFGRLTLAVLVNQFGNLLAIAAVVAGAFYLINNRRLLTWRQHNTQNKNQVNAELTAERAALDKLLSNRGLERTPTETVNQFADRISKQLPNEFGTNAAECYRLYAAARFHPPSIHLLDEVRRLRSILC